VGLGQGGLILLPASLNPLLAKHTLFQVGLSWTNDGRMSAAIKLGSMLLGTGEPSFASDDGRRGSSSGGVLVMSPDASGTHIMLISTVMEVIAMLQLGWRWSVLYEMLCTGTNDGIEAWTDGDVRRR
jgi:hypothetical protein